MSKLLSREEFRTSCFERDGYKCVICGDGKHNGVKLDAHHIIERRLWDDGGYYLDNAATLCDKNENGCHFKAEQTKITIEEILDKIGVKKPLLPENFYDDLRYDKWGNTYLENGKRSKGPLFDDESVQKLLVWCLDDFTEYVKYGRTYHCPWSEGINDDDKVMKDTSNFNGKRVVVTVKLDGENFTGYRNYCHARSVDSRHHNSRSWVKNYHMNYIAPYLLEGWRICGENLYAVHSIKYDNLKSYFYGFSIWDDKNVCQSWDDTIEWFDLLNVEYVDVLYDGIYDEEKIKKLYDSSMYDTCEGYVIRIANSFHYKDFNKCVMKYVRKNHVSTTKHWMFGFNKEHSVNELAK